MIVQWSAKGVLLKKFLLDSKIPDGNHIMMTRFEASGHGSDEELKNRDET